MRLATDVDVDGILKPDPVDDTAIDLLPEESYACLGICYAFRGPTDNQPQALRVHRGSCTITTYRRADGYCDAQTHELKQGDCLLLEPGEVFMLEVAGPGKLYIQASGIFREDFLGNYRGGKAPTPSAVVESAARNLKRYGAVVEK